ncbi:MAG TPA: hypothetical protein VKY26_09205 [Actinomycetota bacterium]|nr:hypothetical protein [Actinomycetota bacterium]
MDEETPLIDENRWAHATGRLEWRTWLCGCTNCREVCRRQPDVLLVIKGTHERPFVNAGQLADGYAEEFLSEGSVLEVYVAQVQPSTRGWPRPPSPILRRLPRAVGDGNSAVSGFVRPQP